MLERDLPWVSEQVSAITLASFRSLVRAPEAKMMLLAPIIMVVVFGSMFVVNAVDLPELVRPLVIFAGMSMVLVGMIQLVGNPHLTDIATEVGQKLQLARSRSGHVPSRAREALAEHRQILRSLANGDSDGAADLMTWHLRRSLANVLSMSDGEEDGAIALYHQTAAPEIDTRRVEGAVELLDPYIAVDPFKHRPRLLSLDQRHSRQRVVVHWVAAHPLLRLVVGPVEAVDAAEGRRVALPERGDLQRLAVRHDFPERPRHIPPHPEPVEVPA